MIAILDTLIDKGGPKAGMLKGFKSDLERGKGLTEGQLKAVRHNLYQNRMRSEADQFRLAADTMASKDAARRGPPGHTSSSAMLKRKGYTPVDLMFGEALPHRRPIVVQGEGVMDRSGKVFLFVGEAGDGSPILAKDDRELERLSKKLIQDRLHVVTSSASRVATKYLSASQRIVRKR